MRILVEITHPAHVHFFRNAIEIWRSHGHEVAITAREKDIVIELLRLYNLQHTVLSGVGKGKLSLPLELIKRDYKLWRFCRKFKPDVLTAISGVFAAHVGFLLKKPVIVWDDTEHQKYSHMLTYPFITQMQSPDCYLTKLGAKQVQYAGCHELAYLHPKRFSPDKNILKKMGINPDEKYCLIRFISWQAHHDVGQHGVAENSKVQFINEISKYAKVYITSESALPQELEQYRLRIAVNQIHHLMAFASLCVTEGATMASESALLAVPVIYINTLTAGTIQEFAKYGLLEHITDTRKALNRAVELLNKPESRREELDNFLKNKIDVTQYVVDTIEQNQIKVL
jgi:predicted glycosyltransferase